LPSGARETAAAARSTPRSTSVIAKSPMITAMKSMPPSSVVVPYAKRREPDMGSSPTSAINAPSAAALSPFTREAPDRLTTTLNARMTRPKYSGGPICSAKSASGGAKKLSPTSPSVPATKEEIAAIASAGPARPWSAI
jgi:hypothetical protein